MLDEIAKEIRAGAAARQKSVTIHYQVLKNAKLLRNMDPKAFCRAVGIEDVWATEFKKMINLAEMIDQKGL